MEDENIIQNNVAPETSVVENTPNPPVQDGQTDSRIFDPYVNSQTNFTPVEDNTLSEMRKMAEPYVVNGRDLGIDNSIFKSQDDQKKIGNLFNFNDFGTNKQSFNYQLNRDDVYTDLGYNKFTDGSLSKAGVILTGAGSGAVTGAGLGMFFGVGGVVGGSIVGGILGAFAAAFPAEHVGKGGILRKDIDPNYEMLAQDESVLTSTPKGLLNTIQRANGVTLNTAGFIYNIPKAIANTSARVLWDNEFSEMLSAYDKSSNEVFHTYETQKYKDSSAIGGVLHREWWGNVALPGFGTLLGVLSVGKLTSGGLRAAGLGAGEASNLGARFLQAGRTIYQGGANKATAQVLYNGFRAAVLRQLSVNKFKALPNLLVSTLTSAAPEAVMEAHGLAEESYENFVQNMNTAYGRPPTRDEVESFRTSMTTAGNASFVTNLGVVGLSNIIQFGDLLGVNKALKTQFLKSATDRLFGLQINKVASKGLAEGLGSVTYSAAKRSFAQRAGYRVFMALEKPISEGAEEGMQGVITKTGQDYLSARHNPRAIDINKSYLTSFRNGLAEQVSTKEGWQEIYAGMMIGALGGTRINRSGPNGSLSVNILGQRDASNRVNGVARSVEELNTTQQGLDKTLAGVFTAREELEAFVSAHMKKFNSNLMGSSQVLTESEAAQVELLKGNVRGSLLRHENAVFAKLAAENRAGNSESVKFNMDMMLDNIPSETLENDYGISSVEEQKKFIQEIKDDYSFQQKKFQLSMDYVENANIVSTDNNISTETLREMAALHVFQGISANENSIQIAKTLQSLVGMDGLASSFKFYSNVANKDGAVLTQIQQARDLSKSLEEERKNLLEQFSKLIEKSTNQENNEENVAKIDEINRKIEANATKIAENEKEHLRLQDILNSQGGVSSDPFGSPATTSFFQESLNESSIAVADVFKNLENLDKYLEHLENTKGKTEDEIDLDQRKAQIIRNLVEDYKEQQMLMRNFAKVANMLGDKSYQNRSIKNWFRNRKFPTHFNNDDWVTSDLVGMDISDSEGIEALKAQVKEGKVSKDDVHTYLTNLNILKAGEEILNAERKSYVIESVSNDLMVALFPNGADKPINVNHPDLENISTQIAEKIVNGIPLTTNEEIIERANPRVKEIVDNILNNTVSNPVNSAQPNANQSQMRKDALETEAQERKNKINQEYNDKVAALQTNTANDTNANAPSSINYTYELAELNRQRDEELAEIESQLQDDIANSKSFVESNVSDPIKKSKEKYRVATIKINKKYDKKIADVKRSETVSIDNTNEIAELEKRRDEEIARLNSEENKAKVREELEVNAPSIVETNVVEEVKQVEVSLSKKEKEELQKAKQVLIDKAKAKVEELKKLPAKTTAAATKEEQKQRLEERDKKIKALKDEFNRKSKALDKEDLATYSKELKKNIDIIHRAWLEVETFLTKETKAGRYVPKGVNNVAEIEKQVSQGDYSSVLSQEEIDFLNKKETKTKDKVTKKEVETTSKKEVTDKEVESVIKKEVAKLKRTTTIKLKGLESQQGEVVTERSESEIKDDENSINEERKDELEKQKQIHQEELSKIEEFRKDLEQSQRESLEEDYRKKVEEINNKLTDNIRNLDEQVSQEQLSQEALEEEKRRLTDKYQKENEQELKRVEEELKTSLEAIDNEESLNTAEGREVARFTKIAEKKKEEVNSKYNEKINQLQPGRQEALDALEQQRQEELAEVDSDLQTALNPTSEEGRKTKETLSSINSFVEELIEGLKKGLREVDSDFINTFGVSELQIKEDLIAYSELAKNTNRTPAEEDEMVKLAQKLNSYGLVEGRVVEYNNQKLRLSDLLEQRAALEVELFNSEGSSNTSMVQVSEDEMNNSTFEDNSDSTSKSYAGDAAVLNTYSTAVYTNKSGGKVISNITLQGLLGKISKQAQIFVDGTLSDVPINSPDFNSKVKVGSVIRVELADGNIEVEMNSSGRLFISDASIEILENNSPIVFSAFPGIGSTGFRSIGVRNGNTIESLPSDFDASLFVDSTAVQNLNPGETISFEVVEDNPYNKELKKTLDEVEARFDSSKQQEVDVMNKDLQDIAQREEDIKVFTEDNRIDTQRRVILSSKLKQAKIDKDTAAKAQLESEIKFLDITINSRRENISNLKINDLNKKKEVFDKHNVKNIAQLKSKVKTFEKDILKLQNSDELDAARLEYQNNMVVMAKDSKGNNVGVLKATSNSHGQATASVAMFRSQIFNQKDTPTTSKVTLVYTGLPNITYTNGTKNTYGFSPTSSPTSNATSSVIATGYVSKSGNVYSDSKQRGKLGNYANKLQDLNVGGRVPVVVVKVGGKDIVYPVNLYSEQKSQSTLNEFDNIVANKSKDIGIFVKDVNDFLSEQGVSTEYRLNSLNLNDSTIFDIRSALGSVSGMPSSSEWLSPSTSRTLLENQGSIDINLENNPFLGPKVRFDLYNGTQVGSNAQVSSVPQNTNLNNQAQNQINNCK